MQSDDSGSRSKAIKLGAASVALIAALIIGYYQLGGPDAADQAAFRPYIDIETGEVFHYTIKEGDIEPIKSPSGKMTGYRAESCYWGKDADGKWFIKDKPTYVVLKSRIDPTSTEETYCPDCGHRVVGHNKKPTQADIDRANGVTPEPDPAEAEQMERD